MWLKVSFNHLTLKISANEKRKSRVTSSNLQHNHPVKDSKANSFISKYKQIDEFDDREKFQTEYMLNRIVKGGFTIENLVYHTLRLQNECSFENISKKSNNG